MKKFTQKAQAYSRCIQRMLRISKLAGGVEALERRLIELEEEICSSLISSRCSHCGSTDIEPTSTVQTPEGKQVVKFRCKACGLSSTEEKP